MPFVLCAYGIRFSENFEPETKGYGMKAVVFVAVLVVICLIRIIMDGISSSAQSSSKKDTQSTKTEYLPSKKSVQVNPDVKFDRGNTQSVLSKEEQTIQAIAQACKVEKAEEGQPNYHGYKLVDNDLGGEPDPLWDTISEVDMGQARRQYRLYGTPGGGLRNSDFSSNGVGSGRKGEQILARMIIANCPNTVSFWSLYGLDEQHHRTDADIDCVIAGQDKQGRTRLWFVDAKNYKGGSDTAYRNISRTRLLRASISQHAFENGPDGRPDLELSGNMNWQRKNWSFMFKGKPIIVEWLVCMVPTTNRGVPDVSGVFWPGGIPCVTPEELVKRVNEADLDSVQNIPLDLLNRFKSQLKRSGYRKPNRTSSTNRASSANRSSDGPTSART